MKRFEYFNNIKLINEKVGQILISEDCSKTFTCKKLQSPVTIINKKPCSEDAVCTNSNNTAKCICKQGFTGDGIICTEIIIPTEATEITIPDIPEVVDPEVVNLEAVEPEVVDPEITVPDILEVVDPEITVPDILEVVDPEITVPDILEVVDPEITVPDILEVVDPEITVPEILENVCNGKFW